MKSTATNAKDYLASLPGDRRTAIKAVRKVILANLDKDYEECMLWGVLTYAVPHRVWPHGHHTDPSKPLMMVGLSSQKNDMVVYLMNVHRDTALREWFIEEWAKTGKKLNLSGEGGCCLRFRKLEHVALNVIGEAVRRTPVKTCIENHLKMLASRGLSPDGQRLKVEAKVKMVTPMKTTKKKVKTKANR